MTDANKSTGSSAKSIIIFVVGLVLGLFGGVMLGPYMDSKGSITDAGSSAPIPRATGTHDERDPHNATPAAAQQAKPADPKKDEPKPATPAPTPAPAPAPASPGTTPGAATPK
jgi:hypothetical protein